MVLKSDVQQQFPKLSKKENVILELLVLKGEMFGLEMVNESSGSLKRGSIYVLLSRMAEKGYVDSCAEKREYPEIGIPRRKFQATSLGETVFIANRKAQEFFETQLGLEGAI